MNYWIEELLDITVQNCAVLKQFTQFFSWFDITNCRYQKIILIVLGRSKFRTRAGSMLFLKSWLLTKLHNYLEAFFFLNSAVHSSGYKMIHSCNTLLIKFLKFVLNNILKTSKIQIREVYQTNYTERPFYTDRTFYFTYRLLTIKQLIT